MANKTQKIRFKQILLVLLLILPCAYAQEKTFVQRLEWLSDAGAFEYRVELQNLEDSKTQEFRTTNSFMEVNLPPGKYRYRVYVFDFLGRQTAVSSWENFEVLKAVKPEISSTVPEASVTDEKGTLELALDLSGLTEESKIELIAEPIYGEVKEDEDGSVKVEFSDIPPGKWRVRITNPGGLSTESDVIEVQENPSTKKTPEKSQEEIEAEARAEAERKAEEERKKWKAYAAAKPPADEKGENVVPNEPPSAEYWKEYAAKKPDSDKSGENVKWKEPKEPRKPYEPKDVFFTAGIGPSISLYDGTLSKYVAPVGLALETRFLFFPKKWENQRLGLELLGHYQRFSNLNDFYFMHVEFLTFGLEAVYQHRFLADNFFVSAKLGGGLSGVTKSGSYTPTYYREDKVISTTFTFIPVGMAGVSFFWVPAKFVAVEVGADFAHYMIQGMPTGIITPYFSIGLRL